MWEYVCVGCVCSKGMHLAFYIVYILKAIACFSYSLLAALGINRLLWQVGSNEIVSQLSTNQIQTFTAFLLQTTILRSLRIVCFHAFFFFFFFMFGLLSVSMNHRPPKQVAYIKYLQLQDVQSWAVWGKPWDRAVQQKYNVNQVYNFKIPSSNIKQENRWN